MYIETDIFHFNTISLYCCIKCIFDQINTMLVSIRHFFKKKILLTLNYIYFTHTALFYFFCSYMMQHLERQVVLCSNGNKEVDLT